MTHFAKNESGAIAVLAAVGISLLVLGAGAAIDFAMLGQKKQRLQGIADATALAVAQQSRLANATPASIQAAAVVQVKALANGMPVNTPQATPLPNNAGVAVQISMDVPLLFGKVTGWPRVTIGAAATARTVGAKPLCMLTTSATAPNAVFRPMKTSDGSPGNGPMAQFEKAYRKNKSPDIGLYLGGATMLANGCTVQTNDVSTTSLYVDTGGSLTAGETQSAGGYYGVVTPAPLTGAPRLGDPLASIQQPTVGACTYTTMQTYTDFAGAIPAGVYCGGLQITTSTMTAGATGPQTILSGDYIIKDGPLIVDGNANIQSDPTNGSSFFLTQTPGGKVPPDLYFGQNTNINLSARTTGPMQGVLLFEDRALSPGAVYLIVSTSARKLNGTIYIPQGILGIGQSAVVGDQSDYTIIVASAVVVEGAQKITINANYSNSTVPVPAGVGPNGAMQLVK
ncbi:MAG: pilus assembly protein [Hyphomicrobiales bacterium]|nr:pilus assembly protein [Hyphomicrobiales bacterium]